MPPTPPAPIKVLRPGAHGGGSKALGSREKNLMPGAAGITVGKAPRFENIFGLCADERRMTRGPLSAVSGLPPCVMVPSATWSEECIATCGHMRASTSFAKGSELVWECVHVGLWGPGEARPGLPVQLGKICDAC